MIQFITGQWINWPVPARRSLVIIAVAILASISLLARPPNLASEKVLVNSLAPPAKVPGLPVIEQSALYELLSRFGAIQIEQQATQKNVLLKSDVAQWHGLLTALSRTAFTTTNYKLVLNYGELSGELILTSGHFSALSAIPWQVTSPGSAIDDTDSLNISNSDLITTACPLMADMMPYTQINLRALWPQRQLALITLNEQLYRVYTRQTLENGWKLQRIDATSATFSHKTDKHTCLHRIPLAVAI